MSDCRRIARSSCIRRRMRFGSAARGDPAAQRQQHDSVPCMVTSDDEAQGASFCGTRDEEGRAYRKVQKSRHS